MKLIERDQGEFRIFAGAMEGIHDDGYIAAVVVRVQGVPGRPSRDVFRDDSLACGHRWATQELALAQAVIRGQAAIMREQWPQESAHCELSMPAL